LRNLISAFLLLVVVIIVVVVAVARFIVLPLRSLHCNDDDFFSSRK
jgi:hypothetical protein